jgi:peptidyl-prolyl cis-trans isomerase D
MLQRIGDSLKGQRWVAILVLGALALVFAAWGAYGIVDLNFGGMQNAAAEVGKQRISMDEVRNAWTQQQARFAQQFGGELPEPFRKQLQEQLLEEMIRNVVITQQATKQGYRVSDAQAHDALREIPAFQVDGKYNRDAAYSILMQQGITIDQFEREIRENLLRAQLARGIQSSDFVTPLELERLHALEDEQRELRYLTLPAEKFARSAAVDDAAIQEYVKKNQAQYMTPESVRLAYAELRQEQVAAQVVVSDADMREAYDKARSTYVQGERRRARHILIAEAPGAQAEAQRVVAQARQPGADFAALAKKFSADTGSASQGGELGWQERGNLAKPFEDALFGMKAGEIAGPIKTEFGYHIIQLEEIQAAHTRTFEEARPEIEAKLRNDRAVDQLGSTQEQIERKLEESNPDFDSLVKEFHLKPGEVPQFTRDAGGAPLGNTPELRELVFSTPVLEEKRIGGPIGVGEDRLVVVKVLEHRKPEPRPIAEIRDEVVAAIRKERGTEAARKAADDARAKLLSGRSFDEIAKSLGVTAEAARFVGRDDPSTPAPIRSVAFEVPPPAGKPIYRAVSLDDGGAAVVAITGSRLDPEGNSSDRLKERREQAAARHGSGDVAAYVAEVRRRADVTKNPKAFE